MMVAEKPGGPYCSTEEAPMATIQKTVVSTEVGPRELSAGLAYVHDIELDGEELKAGQRVEILDGAGDFHAAVVVDRVGPRWKLSIQP